MLSLPWAAPVTEGKGKKKKKKRKKKGISSLTNKLAVCAALRPKGRKKGKKKGKERNHSILPPPLQRSAPQVLRGEKGGRGKGGDGGKKGGKKKKKKVVRPSQMKLLTERKKKGGGGKEKGTRAMSPGGVATGVENVADPGKGGREGEKKKKKRILRDDAPHVWPAVG